MLLGIPLNGCDPAPRPPGHEVGQPQGLPRGRRRAARGLRGPAHAARGGGTRSASCARGGPGIRRAVVKLNDSFSGEGNALFRYPESGARAALRDGAAAGRVLGALGDAGGLLRQVLADGRDRRGVHRGRGEALAERPAADQPARGRGGDLHPRPDPRAGRAARCSSAAASRPATTTACAIQEAGLRIGQVLAAHGVVSRFGVDFLVHRDSPAEDRGRSPPSRSTCAWAAPPTRTWRCSS